MMRTTVRASGREAGGSRFAGRTQPACASALASGGERSAEGQPSGIYRLCSGALPVPRRQGPFCARRCTLAIIRTRTEHEDEPCQL
jgi:hypothetical protein